MATLLESALEYAAASIPVFPATPRGKVPLTTHGFRDATTDADTIRLWWAKWPHANIGIPTGDASGLFVVDVDPKSNGHYAFDGLIEVHGQPPPTPKSKTQSGGTHLFFRHRPGLRNSAGKIGPGIDTRGDGGYIIAPPSIGEHGTYEWEDGAELADIAPPEVPEWLTPGALAVTGGNLGFVVGAGPANEADDVPAGGRNNAAASLAGQYIAQGMSLRDARAALEGAHADPFSRMCYPCVYAVSRLIPIAREAVCENHTAVINTPDLVAKAVGLGRAGAGGGMVRRRLACGPAMHAPSPPTPSTPQPTPSSKTPR
jgi:hypothetical protein